MFSKIINAEQLLSDLLPGTRPEDRLPAGLITTAGAWSETVWAVAEQLGPMSLSIGQIEQGLQLAQAPVFICGVHRSGTTLLKDMLDGHPDLVVLPSEGTYYTNLEHKLLSLPENEWAAFLGKEWLRRLANPINQPPYWLLGRSDDQASPYVNFARYLMAWWRAVDHIPGTQWPHMAIVLAYASCTGNLTARAWVDKTPTNERFIDRIRQEMPGAKIIHLLREPVATLTSRKKMEPAAGLRNALRYLKASLRIAARQQGSPGFLLLRYEDVCNEPRSAAKQLADFLGIPALAVLSRPTVAGRPSLANSSFGKPTQAGIILKPVPYTQKGLLTRAEQQLIAACTGRLAGKHNYAFEKIGLLHSIYLKLRYRVF
ncbi:sulfotransferase family protein [Mucilaginibacter ginsenosidivorans]|nr:sulfotransferase [Mucilaginibacter ginsenosidivorans]